MTDSYLLRRINEAQHNTVVWFFIRRQVTGILTALGMPWPKAMRFMGTLLMGFESPVRDLHLFEQHLHERLKREIPDFDIRLKNAMRERAELTWMHLHPQLKSHTTVLDLGGGSGEIGSLVAGRYDCRVTIADTIDWRIGELPFRKVIGNHVQAKDNEFDTVLLLTVLHHSDAPEILLGEAFRVASRRVIIIESVVNSHIEALYGSWIDWFYNRVVHYSEDPRTKVNVPLNFRSAPGWSSLIDKTVSPKALVESTDLGIYQHLNPERHHLFVYDV